MAHEPDSTNKITEVFDYKLPPWKAYPQIQFGSIGWRMGYGEKFIVNWSKYYFSLSELAREKYKLENPPPSTWPENYYEIKEKNKLKKDEFYKKIGKT